MKLYPEKLEAQLKQGLLPIYLLSGEAPLQLGEAADAVRRHGREQGYTEREVLDVDKGFDWNALLAESQSMSLFAERKIIDLRIPSGKLGKEGSAALLEYAARPPEDTVLLITAGKIDKRSQSAKWFKTIDDIGGVLQVWPVEATEMPGWLDKRMRSRGLQPDAANSHQSHQDH